MILHDYGYETVEISIAVVDGSSMRQLNNRYLQHDYDTDVLSFVLDCDPDIGLLNGQLIVSTDTAAEMAGQLDLSLDAELLLYVVHGSLHLVGFDDKTPTGADEMRQAEKEYLAKFNLPHVWSRQRALAEGETVEDPASHAGHANLVKQKSESPQELKSKLESDSSPSEGA